MKQPATFIHALPPPPDDPALAAMQAANRIRRGPFLRCLRRIERTDAGRNDGQRASVRIEIEQRPSDRGDPAVDTQNSHVIFPRAVKPHLTGRYHSMKTAKGKSVGKPRQSGFLTTEG
jgi:hypothetical protein